MTATGHAHADLSGLLTIDLAKGRSVFNRPFAGISMSARKSLIWSYSSQAVIFTVGFATSIVVARLLMPRDFGIFAIGAALASVLGVFTSFSVNTYLIREKRLTTALLRTSFTVNAVMATVLCLSLAIMSLLVTYLFHRPEVGKVLLITSLSPLPGIFEFMPSTLSMREMRYGLVSAVNALRTIVASAVVLLLAFNHVGPASLAAGPVAAAAVTALIYTIARWSDTVFRLSFKGFKPLLIFGGQMISIGGVAQIASRASDLVLARFQGLTQLGLYSRASSLSNLIFYNVYGSSTGVIFAKMSRELRDIGSIHETFVRAIRMITGVMWPLLIGIAILSRPIVANLYGVKWLDAALPLSLLMVAQFIVIGFGMNWEIFVLRNETALQTRFEFYRALLGTGAFAVGSLFGITAAACGRIVEAAVGYALYRPHMDRMTGAEPGEVEGVYRESLALTVVAVVPSAVLMAWSNWAAETSLWSIAGAVLLGLAGWTAVLAARAHPIADEARILWTRVGRLAR